MASYGGLSGYFADLLRQRIIQACLSEGVRCVCVHILRYIHTYIHLYISTYIHKYIHEHTHAYMFARFYVAGLNKKLL